MNYLAHLYLGKANDELVVGNFIADFVKGSKFNNYSPEISRGIVMHRLVDSITDCDESYLVVQKMFVQSYGRYSGIIADISYDYVLARNWENFSTVSLSDFQKKINKILLHYFPIVPFKAKLILPFFIRNKWLTLYQTPDSIKSVFVGMGRYRGVEGDVMKAVETLQMNEALIFEHFICTLQSITAKIKSEFSELTDTENSIAKCKR